MKTLNFQKAAAGFILLLGHYTSQAQSDACAGAGALPINTTCVNTAWSLPGSYTNELGTIPSCMGTVNRDCWYTFTATGTSTTITGSNYNRDLGLAIYSGTCGSLTEIGCADDFGAGGAPEVVTVATTVGQTYFIRIIRVNANNNGMAGDICITSPVTSGTTITTCSDTFTDNGGGGNYTANSDYTVTYCPSTAGQCISAAFSSFDTEDGFDYLEVYDGDSDLEPALAGSPFSGTVSPGTLTGTTSNATGCLTFHFVSDGSVQSTGWSATISCAPCVVPDPALAQDCEGGTTVCSDASFSGNSSGSGNDVDLDLSNEGCLSGEHQSSWYYFSPSTSGTVALNITPSDLSDDYDFAIWGPLGSITCPPATAPLRCSYAGTTGITGLNASAGSETTESASGDGFVSPINVVAGQMYILLVDNFSSSSSPFTLDWTLSGGASLNCTVLPVELVNFSATPVDNRVELKWTTMSETNNSHFIIEKSLDGIHFVPLIRIPGAGTTTASVSYKTYDNNPAAGTSYYRLSQTDYDGKTVSFNIVPVTFRETTGTITFEAYPVPAKEIIHLQFGTMVSEGTQVSITDITGRVIMTHAVSEDTQHLSVPLAGLVKGVYFVTAENTLQHTRSALRRIVVE